MKAFKERLERIEVEEPVYIPNLERSGIAETITVKVPAWRDPKDGEIYLDNEATAIIDKVKARHMGLLTPDQIKALRKRLGLTQPQISELLQIGEKTWTRWETGRERPSRSINVLLFALNDGKLDVPYLRSVAQRRNDWASRLTEAPCAARNPWLITVQEIWQKWEPEAGRELDQAICEDIVCFMRSRGEQREFLFKMETRPNFGASMPRNVISVQFGREAARFNDSGTVEEPRAATVPEFGTSDEALFS